MFVSLRISAAHNRQRAKVKTPRGADCSNRKTHTTNAKTKLDGYPNKEQSATCPYAPQVIKNLRPRSFLSPSEVDLARSHALGRLEHRRTSRRFFLCSGRAHCEDARRVLISANTTPFGVARLQASNVQMLARTRQNQRLRGFSVDSPGSGVPRRECPASRAVCSVPPA